MYSSATSAAQHDTQIKPQAQSQPALPDGSRNDLLHDMTCLAFYMRKYIRIVFLILNRISRQTTAKTDLAPLWGIMTRSHLLSIGVLPSSLQERNLRL